MRQIMAGEGIEAAISEYLSAAHRDNPDKGCTLAALLPELARQPIDSRKVFAEGFLATTRELASALPHHVEDKEGAAMALYAVLVGTLQLARAVKGMDLSDRILAAGADAARALAHLEPVGAA